MIAEKCNLRTKAHIYEFFEGSLVISERTEEILAGTHHYCLFASRDTDRIWR